jgi:hypothetical protein
MTAILAFIAANYVYLGLGAGAIAFAWDDVKAVYAKAVTGNKTPEQIDQDKAMSHYEGLVRFAIKHGTPETVAKVTALVNDIKVKGV